MKLTDYLADFKDIQHQSRIEIVFLLIFFVLLFIPMSHINQDEISVKENRILAVYKPLFEKHQKINYNYGKDFEKWYNDRYNLRYSLVQAYYHLKFFINSNVTVNNLVLIKNNNWVLNKDFKVPDNIDMNSNFGKYLGHLQNFCDEHNIKLYVIISPEREALNIDKYPFYYNKKPENFIQEPINSEINIIYPYQELVNANKKDYVYFKTDHHWTDYGAYVVSNILLNKIRQDFPQVQLINTNDYEISYSNKVKSEFDRIYDEGVEISVFCPFFKKYAKRILDTQYPYYIHKNENLLKVNVHFNEHIRGRDYVFPYGTNLKVLQMGTSMNENLMDFLPYQFKHLKYIRLNGPIGMKEEEQLKILKYYKDDIISYKPDILVLCITPLNIKSILKYGE